MKMAKLLVAVALALVGAAGPVGAQGITYSSASDGDYILQNQSGLTATTTQTAIEEAVKTITIPANTLGPTGAFTGFSISWTAEHAANTNSATYHFRFGGIGGADQAVATSTESGGAHQVYFWCQAVTSSTLNCQGMNSKKGAVTTLYGSAAITGVNFAADYPIVITMLTPTAIGDFYVSSVRTVLYRRR